MHWRVEIHDQVVVLQQSKTDSSVTDSSVNAVPAYKTFLYINMFGNNNMTTC